MGKLGKSKAILSLILCVALLHAGPASPMRAYASVDDDDEAYDSDYEYEEDLEDDDIYEPEDSVSTSSNNAEIQKIQQEINVASQRLEDIKKEQTSIENSLNKTKAERAKAEQARDNVGYQISLTENEIAALVGRINGLEQKIVLLEQEIDQRLEEIAEKQGEIDYSYDLFKKRLRARQLQDDGSMLGLVLGSDSFSDFVTSTEHMSRIAQHDQELMAFLTQERIAIEEEKATLEANIEELENDISQVEDDKKIVESKKGELSVQYNEAASNVHDIASMEQQFNADLEKNKALQQKMRAEMDALFKQMEFIKTPYAGGVMANPLPSHTSVTSVFGSRFGGSDYHTGIDLSGTGIHGASIVAANDGTVSKVNLNYTNGYSGGYGMYVVIDHGVGDNGQNISTMYAHCSAILVSEGQQVTKGQTIAQVGNTGWSTGPHLHFEVRMGTQAVNPAPYIGK